MHTDKHRQLAIQFQIQTIWLYRYVCRLLLFLYIHYLSISILWNDLLIRCAFAFNSFSWTLDKWSVAINTSIDYCLLLRLRSFIDHILLVACVTATDLLWLILAQFIQKSHAEPAIRLVFLVFFLLLESQIELMTRIYYSWFEWHFLNDIIHRHSIDLFFSFLLFFFWFFGIFFLHETHKILLIQNLAYIVNLKWIVYMCMSVCEYVDLYGFLWATLLHSMSHTQN